MGQVKVAEGRSLACLRGVVDAGTVIEAKDLNRNPEIAEKSLKSLIARGVLTCE